MIIKVFTIPAANVIDNGTFLQTFDKVFDSWPYGEPCVIKVLCNQIISTMNIFFLKTSGFSRFFYAVLESPSCYFHYCDSIAIKCVIMINNGLSKKLYWFFYVFSIIFVISSHDTWQTHLWISLFSFYSFLRLGITNLFSSICLWYSNAISILSS